jgi:hypothetical protein
MLDAVTRAGFTRTATVLETDFFDGWAFNKTPSPSGSGPGCSELAVAR